jgi:hypothetical protein
MQDRTCRTSPPTLVDLVFNLTTAKGLGLRFQESFLLRVDEVIE